MVDSSPALAKNFIEKFETMREARKKWYKSIIEFDFAHKQFFMHETPDTEDMPLWYE